MTDPLDIDYKIKPTKKRLDELKQFVKEVREYGERKELFEHWRLKLELPEKTTLQEFFDKLKLYQNLHPDE